MSNELQYLENIIDSRWQESYVNRRNDVPYPGKERIYIGEEAENVRTAAKDYIVLSKGVTTKTPRGFGHTHRRREHTGTVSVRSRESRERVFGGRDSNNDCEDYGGLAGEVERILDEVRQGHKEFDSIRAPEVTETTDFAEAGTWRAEVEFDLRILAEVIAPDRLFPLTVASGETYTVAAGDSEEYSYADIDGELDVDGELNLRGEVLG